MGPPVDLRKVKTIVAGPNGPFEGASRYGPKGPIGSLGQKVMKVTPPKVLPKTHRWMTSEATLEVAGGHNRGLDFIAWISYWSECSGWDTTYYLKPW